MNGGGGRRRRLRRLWTVAFAQLSLCCMATARDAGARGERGSLGLGLAGERAARGHTAREALLRPLYLVEALASRSMAARRLTCTRTRKRATSKPDRPKPERPLKPERHPIKEALLLHNDSYSNVTFEDCIWRRDREPCPDPDVTLHLYTETEPVKNVPPCYVAAVHNLRPAARCAAEALGSLRKAGLRPDRLTCVGHSLGAHMCGIIANYLTFRLNRIIDPGDARAVHVLHTNAGRYGEAARLGHADFCLNGGRSGESVQPALGGAVRPTLLRTSPAGQGLGAAGDAGSAGTYDVSNKICYQAESLFNPRSAAPCGRRCSVRVPPGRASALPVMLGQPAPM
ncbi:Lipase, partial [Operophtera brumata]